MPFGLIRFVVASFIAAAAAVAASGGFAQDNPATPPAAQAPAAPSPAPAAPPAANPAQPPPSPTTPAPPLLKRPSPARRLRRQAKLRPGETVDLPARPFAYIEGKADRDEIYSAILGSLGLVKRDMEKASLKSRRVGRSPCSSNPTIPAFNIMPDFRLMLGARRKSEPFRRGEDRSDAQRQGDALRASWCICGY